MKKKSASGTVAAMIAATLLSKLLGLARQIIFASVLGDGVYAVAFASASKITLSVFDMLFSAAILGCFIPFYSSSESCDEERARLFSSSFFTFTLIATAVLSLLGALFSREIILICTPNLSERASRLAAKLLSIMFPMMIFTGAAYVLVGILQSHGSFILPALISSLSNALIIVWLLVGGDIGSDRGISVLAGVYVLSWAVQLLTLAVPLMKRRLFPSISLRFSESGLHAALKMSPTVIVGAWLLPASALAANFFSSLVSDETVAAFDYSLSVWTIAAGVLTYGVCNFIFPKLSRLSGDGEGFLAVARRGVGSALLLSLPVAAGMWALGENIICVLYMRGNFTAELASSCGRILSALAVSAPAYCVTEVLFRVFYAKKSAFVPMAASISGICALAVSGTVSHFSGGGETGVAVSYCVGQYTAAIVLTFVASKRFSGFISAKDAPKAILGAVSAAICALVCRAGVMISGENATNSSLIENFLICAIVFLCGCVVYLICMIIFGLIKSPVGKED